jgi:hypothetical protein
MILEIANEKYKIGLKTLNSSTSTSGKLWGINSSGEQSPLAPRQLINVSPWVIVRVRRRWLVPWVGIEPRQWCVRGRGMSQSVSSSVVGDMISPLKKLSTAFTKEQLWKQWNKFKEHSPTNIMSRNWRLIVRLSCGAFTGYCRLMSWWSRGRKKTNVM